MTTRGLTTRVAALALALSTAGSTDAQVDSRILPRTEIPLVRCSDPPLEPGSIRLDTARLTEAGNQIVLEGCFGLNRSKKLGVWLRGNTGTAAAPKWVFVKNRRAHWQGARATIAWSSALAGGATEIEATLVRLEQSSSPAQLTPWVSVAAAPTPRAPAHGPVDADGDGSYSIASGGDDCGDNDRRRYPGNTEVADAGDIDEDCDPATFGVLDLDRDGYTDARACNSNGGHLICGTDCDDSNASIHPNQIDILNGRDDDCDSDVDEDQTIEMVRRLLDLVGEAEPATRNRSNERPVR